jgi:glycosyltransferase involved in cell wall biosynthesis
VTNVALCHEWLTERRGSEKTFETMAEAFPEADLYALTREGGSEFDFGGRSVKTTLIDRIAPLKHRRALQLPLMPLAWRYASRERYDVVVTNSHACSKGFWPGRQALHLCYCHTPMRYVWLSTIDRRHDGNPLARLISSKLRSWDLTSVDWVDEFAASSQAVQERIQAVYGRESTLIYPPVQTDYYTPGDPGGKKEFALAVSRMVPYKKFDLAIEACHRAGYPLVIAGSGPEEHRLRALAAELGADVRFEISPSDQRLLELYRTARAVIFPAEEDFGVVSVEAQACGTPMVAFGRGGTLDTVIDGVTGILVPEQDAESMAIGLKTALETVFDPDACRQNAERFSARRFQQEFRGWIVDAATKRGLTIDDSLGASGLPSPSRFT